MQKNILKISKALEVYSAYFLSLANKTKHNKNFIYYLSTNEKKKYKIFQNQKSCKKSVLFEQNVVQMRKLPKQQLIII